MWSSPRCIQYMPVFVMMLVVPAFAHSRFTVSKIKPASSSAPSPRSEHLAVVINSGDGPLLVIHGGRDHNGLKSDTWTYLVSKNQWTLLVPSSLPLTQRPPPVYGAVGGYRFVEGKPSPFLYVLFGMSTAGRINDQMWVMDFENFTWNRVEATGDIPEARYGAIGSLERFVRPDGSVESAMIVSHGLGENGLLSNTYKCSFHDTDPFRVSWKLLGPSVSQYSTLQPHPMWKQASSYTANRDLVVFGGCYASQKTGGRCPHSDIWVLQYKQQSSFDLDGSDPFVNQSSTNNREEMRSIQWRRAPSEPGPRLGAAMSQGLSSFEGAYENYLSTVVLYGGSLSTENTSQSPFVWSPEIDANHVSIFSTQALAWARERVEFLGPPDERSSVVLPKTGMSMNVVKIRDEELGTTDEFYLLFGGQDPTNSFSSLLLKLSFDGFVESDVPDVEGRYVSRPFIHGLAMFLSWGLMMIIGVGILRYGRSNEKQTKLIVLHICCQVLALVLVWVGLAVVRKGRNPSNPSFAHARLGTGLIILIMFQGLTASIKALTGRFKRVIIGQRRLGRMSFVQMLHHLSTCTHRVVGLILLPLGWINITLGLLLILSPTILWVHWIAWCGCAAVVVTIMELGRDRKLFKYDETSRNLASSPTGNGTVRERKSATLWRR